MSTIKTTNLQHPSAASPNLTLAADGSVSGGAGLGGLVHIATESVNGVSSVSLDNVFTSTYDNYRLSLSLTTTTGCDVSFRLRAASVDASTDYTYARTYIGVSDTTAFASDRYSTSHWIIGATSTSPGNVFASESEIFDPSAAKITRWISDSTARLGMAVKGLMNNTTQYDGFTVYATSSALLTGTIRVYGYANS